MKTNLIPQFFVIALVLFFSGCSIVSRTVSDMFPPPPGQGKVVTIGDKSFESMVSGPFGPCGSNDTIIVHNSCPPGYSVCFIEQGTRRFILPPAGVHSFNPMSSWRNFPLNVQAVVFTRDSDGTEREVRTYDRTIDINSMQGSMTFSWNIRLDGDNGYPRYMPSG